MANFDFTSFHPGCDGVNVVAGPSGFLVVCPKCRVASDLEGVSKKTNVPDALKVGMPGSAEAYRPATGKMSLGVK